MLLRCCISCIESLCTHNPISIVCSHTVPSLALTAVDCKQLPKFHRRAWVRRVAPAASKSAERVAADLDLSLQLAQALRAEAGAQHPSITDSWLLQEAGVSPVRRLNAVLAYLREVHCYCFYCSEQFENPDELFLACGEYHARGAGSAARPQDADFFAALEKGLRSRMAGPPLATAPASAVQKRLMGEFFDKLMKKKSEEKWKCLFEGCAKAFQGPNFLMKHIESKHSEAHGEAQQRAVEQQAVANYLDSLEADRLQALDAHKHVHGRNPNDGRGGDQPYQQNRPLQVFPQAGGLGMGAVGLRFLPQQHQQAQLMGSGAMRFGQRGGPGSQPGLLEFQSGAFFRGPTGLTGFGVSTNANGIPLIMPRTPVQAAADGEGAEAVWEWACFHFHFLLVLFFIFVSFVGLVCCCVAQGFFFPLFFFETFFQVCL